MTLKEIHDKIFDDSYAEGWRSVNDGPVLTLDEMYISLLEFNLLVKANLNAIVQ